MSAIRAAVVGVGAFGRNHVRVIRGFDDVELVGVVDVDPERAQIVAADYGAPAFESIDRLAGRLDAAIIATPTATHGEIAHRLLDAGVDVLIEKPITSTSEDGAALARLAEERGRILQVGHLERFNPAVMALEGVVTLPLFFEIHRLSVFTPRSLDIDVVLDLMIHDLDIVLSLTRTVPVDISAAGISVLSRQVDIANVRLSFANGCVANLTASRVSTERVRKLRLFQPGEYISLDYERQQVFRLGVLQKDFRSDLLEVERAEPLALELAAFFECVRTRQRPRVDGLDAVNVLRVAEAIVAKMKEHGELVSATLRGRK